MKYGGKSKGSYGNRSHKNGHGSRSIRGRSYSGLDVATLDWAKRDANKVEEMYPAADPKLKTKLKRLLINASNKAITLSNDPLFTENPVIDVETGKSDVEELKEIADVYKGTLKKLS